MRLIIVLGSLVVVCLIATVAVLILRRRTGRGAPGRPGGRDEGTIRAPAAETLTIVPVAPNLDALGDVAARLREEVDVILALPHGPGAGLRRELLPAAERLYTEMRISSPSGGGQR